MNPSTHEAPEQRRWARAWGALVDANPVLAKELLVTARTPVFVGSMILTPLALGALVLIVQSGRRSGTTFDPEAGRHLFSIYFTGLSLALGTVGAALGSTVIVQEREAGALDAYKFSALSASRIVLGKAAAVILAELALVVCTIPLLAFVLGQGGVSLGEAGIAMAFSLACGGMTASVGVGVSARVANTRRSLLLALVGGAIVGIGASIWLAVGADLGSWYGPFGVTRAYFEPATRDVGRYFAVLYVIPAFALAIVPWLGHAAATSGLMDLSEDRSLPIKRWALGAYAAGLLALVACTSVADGELDKAIVCGSMVAVATVAAVLLFVFAGEPLVPTRRMQVQPPSAFVRALFPRCLAPSTFFTVVASGVALVSVPVIAGSPAHYRFDALWTVACLAALGGFMGTVATRRGATHARRFGAGVLFGLTFLFVTLRVGTVGATWVDGICPIFMFAEGHGAQDIMTSSLAAWGTAAVAALALMQRAVRARA